MANTYRPRRWYQCRTKTCGHVKRSARWSGCPKCNGWPHRDLGSASMMTKREAQAQALSLP